MNKEAQEALQEKFDALKSSLEAGFASKEEVKKATDSLEEIKKSIDKSDANQKKEFDHLAEQLNQLKESSGLNNGVAKTVFEVVDKWLSENMDTVKSTLKDGKGILSLAGLEKAVATMTSANITLPTPLPAGYVAERDGVPYANLRRPTLLSHVNTFSTNQKTLTYVEMVGGEGDFEVVLEGGLKPQLDLDFEERFVQPTKFAGWIKVTDELIEDYPRMRDVIVNYLTQKHDLFKERKVYEYIDANSTAYVTGGALSGAVTLPNIMDVVGAMQSQIINSPNYTDEADFMGDTVLMNNADFFRYFGFAKDTLGRPLYDNGYQVGNVFRLNGFTFVATSLVTAGEIKLYDSTKIDLTNYIPYHVQIGWVNDDFIRNQFVILGESRGHIYIKEHDKRAFVEAVIADVIADIAQTAPVEGGE